jgi:hypothetical protein
MVGDRKWEKWMANFCKPFTRAKVRYFDKSDVDAAWEWLESNEEESKVGDELDQAFDRSEEPDICGTYPWYWS